MHVFHIAARKAWEEARRQGAYSPPTLAREGFIHLSTYGQVVAVADAVFRGQADLVLLRIDTSRLTSPLAWDAPAHPEGAPPPDLGDERIPHLYGPLEADAVDAVFELTPGPDGRFTLPRGATGARGGRS